MSANDTKCLKLQVPIKTFVHINHELFRQSFKPMIWTSPSLTSTRRALSYCRQPFDEALLPGMPFADRAEPAGEILTRALFPGDHAQVMQKACRLVISSGVAPPDFGLDLAPDAFTPPRDCVKPRPAGFFCLHLLPAQFRSGLPGFRTLAHKAD